MAFPLPLNAFAGTARRPPEGLRPSGLPYASGATKTPRSHSFPFSTAQTRFCNGLSMPIAKARLRHPWLRVHAFGVHPCSAGHSGHPWPSTSLPVVPARRRESAQVDGCHRARPHRNGCRQYFYFQAFDANDSPDTFRQSPEPTITTSVGGGLRLTIKKTPLIERLFCWIAGRLIAAGGRPVARCQGQRCPPARRPP